MHVFDVVVTRSSYLYSVIFWLHVAGFQRWLHSWEKDQQCFRESCRSNPEQTVVKYTNHAVVCLHNVLVIGNPNCWNPKCCDYNYRGLQFLYPWSGRNVGSVSPQRHVAFLKIAAGCSWIWSVSVAVSPYSRVFFPRCTGKVKYNYSLMFLEGEIVDFESFLCVCGCI